MRIGTPCARSTIASGARRKVASILRALSASTTVGNSLKRCESKRVDEVVVLEAYEVTGQVRWHVTGK